MVGKFGSIDGRSLQFYLFPYSFLLDNLCFRSKVMIICVVSSIRVRQWLFYIWLPYDNELMLTKARMISINILYSWWSQMFDMNWCYNIANCVLRCHVFVSYCCCTRSLLQKLFFPPSPAALGAAIANGQLAVTICRRGRSCSKLGFFFINHLVCCCCGGEIWFIL